MERKLCVIYNTCAMNGRENTGHYLGALESILAQDFEGCRVVISDCSSPPSIRDRLKGSFGNRVSYSFIDAVLPIFVTFNWSAMQAAKALGEFEAYVYVDSGISFGPRDVLAKLYARFKELGPNTDMVAVPIEGDNSSYGAVNKPEPFQDGDIKVGEHINLHCLLVSERLRQAYGGKCLPDVFAGIGSEGTYPYLCSALRTRFLLTTDIPRLSHAQSLDGPNQGFPAGGHYGMYVRETPIREIARQGSQYGFGFEEFFNMDYAGDHSRFDGHGLSVDDQLYRFLKAKLFLSPDELNYDAIMGAFSP